MSNSLGNSIDPLTIIDEYSADALRYSLMMITATGQDVFLSNDKFEIGRNFGTKIWNAARFIQMQERESGAGPAARALKAFDPALLSADDLHILAKLEQASVAYAENLRRFRFNDAARDLYEFIWHQFCDWYVEYSKDVLYGDDLARKTQVLAVMLHAFASALRLLHPYMPFLTEELWHGMGFGGADDSIMTSVAPSMAVPAVDADTVAYVDARHELIRAGRMLRADCGIAPGQRIDYIAKPNTEDLAKRLQADQRVIAGMLKAKAFTVDAAFAPSKGVPSVLTELGTVYMPIEGLVDTAAESAKLVKQIGEATVALERVEQKLNNPSFVSKAPPAIIAQQEARRTELRETLAKLERLKTMMG
jgi:valyl-tRNA synthetase